MWVVGIELVILPLNDRFKGRAIRAPLWMELAFYVGGALCKWLGVRVGRRACMQAEGRAWTKG